MPSVSVSQQHLMGADLARKRAGKRTRTGMSEEQLREFAATKTKGLPKHARKSRSRRMSRSDRLAALRAGRH